MITENGDYEDQPKLWQENAWRKNGSLRSIIWEFMGKMWKKLVDIGDKILRQKYVNHSDSNDWRNEISLWIDYPANPAVKMYALKVQVH